jgi:3-methyladenine DNA glycosylase Tag
MQSFEEIYQRAAMRKGGVDELEALFPAEPNLEAVLSVTNEQALSLMTKAIFKAGFVWRVVENMWPRFEDAFWVFDIWRCAYISPEEREALYVDERIIRNAQKIDTVPLNALMIIEIADKHGSFSQFIADWPASDQIGLLDYLKKHGSRLGGMTAQYCLRSMGKDSFVLGRDVVAALIQAGVIDKAPTSKAAMKAVQTAFNRWHEETGFSYTKMSRTLAYSIDS